MRFALRHRLEACKSPWLEFSESFRVRLTIEELQASAASQPSSMPNTEFMSTKWKHDGWKECPSKIAWTLLVQIVYQTLS